MNNFVRTLIVIAGVFCLVVVRTWSPFPATSDQAYFLPPSFVFAETGKLANPWLGENFSASLNWHGFLQPYVVGLIARALGGGWTAVYLAVNLLAGGTFLFVAVVLHRLKIGALETSCILLMTFAPVAGLPRSARVACNVRNRSSFSCMRGETRYAVEATCSFNIARAYFGGSARDPSRYFRFVRFGSCHLYCAVANLRIVAGGDFGPSTFCERDCRSILMRASFAFVLLFWWPYFGLGERYTVPGRRKRSTE